MGRFLTLSTFVILAVVVIAATIPSFIDWQSYREPIERAASDAVGREVKIAGRVGFTILPHPTVELGGVTITNRDGGASTNFLTLETLSAKLALAPLLRGAVQVETFEIEGADLRLERSKDAVNWMVTRGEDDKGGSGGGIEALLIKAIRDISIKDFSAKDVKISYADLASGKTYAWEVKHGQASLASTNGPFEGEGRIILGGEAFYVTGKLGALRPDRPRSVTLDAVTADGLSVKFDGTTDRSTGSLLVQGRTEIKAPKAQQLGVPFAAVTGTRRGAWGGASSFDLPAKLVGQMEISAAGIRSRELEIELGSQKGVGEVDLVIAPSVSGTIRIAAKTLDIDKLLKALTLSGVEAAETGPAVDVEIAVVSRAATFRKTRLDDVEFSVRLLNSGPALGSFNAMLPGQTRAVYQLGNGDADRGRLEIETANARAFLAWMGADLDGSRARAFRTLKLSGDVILGKKNIKLTGFNATLDGVKVEGAIIRTRSKRPSWGANLKVMGLDLARFGTGSNVGAWLDYLASFDVNAILKLRQFSGFDLERRSADMKVQVVRGALTLEDLQVYGSPDLRFRGKLAKDENGLINGKMRIDADKLELCALIKKRAALDLAGCDKNPAFKSTGRFEVIRGRVSGDVVSKAKGLSFDGKLGNVETLFSPAFNITFDGAGKVGGLTYKLKGTAKDNKGETLAKAHIDAQAPGLDTFLKSFPGSRAWSKPLLELIEDKGAVTLAADLTVSPQATHFDAMELAMGAASVTGSGSLSAGKAGDVFDLKLTGHNLTMLEPYGRGDWSTKPLGLTVPKSGEGTFALTLVDTLLGGVPVPTASLRGQVKAGGVSLDVREASAFGATWEGDVTLHESKGGLIASAEGKARSLKLDSFLSTALRARSLTGEGDLTFSVSSHGRSWKSLVESSAGMVSLKARDGLLRGFDLPGFGVGLTDASGELGARLVVEGALSGGTTRFTSLDSEMALADGKLRTISLSGDLDGGTLSGDGEINLGDLSLKGRIDVRLTDHETLPKVQGTVSGKLKKVRTTWDAEELVLKFTEAWILANRETEMPALPGSEGSGVKAEELDELLPATEP